MNRVLTLLGMYGCGVLVFLSLATHGSHTDDSTGKMLRLAIDTEPKTLDPIGITDTISDGVAHKVFNTLVRLEKDNATRALIVGPELAKAWNVSPDGKTYTFTLLTGVKFHNGREMKAEDAVYSLSRLLSPRSKRSEWIRPMVVGSEEYYKDPKSAVALGIKATGEYELTITLNAPFAPFIQHLCTSNCAIVPKEAVEDPTRLFARNPVGTGPFQLVEWRTYQMLLFRRNDDYFRGKPKLSTIRFSVIKDHNVQLEQFLAGDLDAAGIPYGQVKDAIEKAGPGNSLSYSTFRTNYIGIGMPNGKFKDKKDLSPFGTNKLLRQAINYALDRQYLCDTVLEGRGVPATSVLPPGMPAYKERPGWPKDVARAKALLAQAGFPNGEGLPVVTLLHRNDEDTKKIAQSILHDLDQVGIKAELQAREWNKFLDVCENEPQSMFMLGWVADYPDPDNFLYVLFNTSQAGPPGNNTWYSNAEVDALTAKARTLSQMNERIPLYQRAEDIILDESPWICTYHARNKILLRKEVTGIREHVTPLDTGTEFPQVDFAGVDISE